MIIIILIFIGKHILLSNQFYRLKSFSIGAGNDRIITYEPIYDNYREFLINNALTWISTNISESETFAVLPEGVMLNYLARRKSSVRYINFMPPEVIFFGEKNILNEFVKKPPDYIMLIYKNTEEYGFHFLGSNIDYGKATMSWINQNYSINFLAEDKPSTDSNAFSIKILKKNKRFL